MVEYPSELWKDYALLDSGHGLKLERFGSFVLARPEPKALWDPSLSEKEWNSLAHVRFKPGAGFGKAGKEDSGTWEKLKAMPDQWNVEYPGKGFNLRMRLGLTAFKHVGIFPEQAPNWEWIHSKVSSSSRSETVSLRSTPPPAEPAVPPLMEPRVATDFRPTLPDQQVPKVLNLFAYTGGASLAAKSADADVTHLDSVRQVVTWARENMENSGMDGIRWIVEDAMKFVRREVKRGHLYDGIILDPPAYGHGPDGEKWKLDELLFEMLRGVSSILDPEHGWMVLNLYSNGYSAALGETVVREAFGLSAGKGGYSMESGELALNDKFGKSLPLSIFVRLEL